MQKAHFTQVTKSQGYIAIIYTSVYMWCYCYIIHQYHCPALKCSFGSWIWRIIFLTFGDKSWISFTVAGLTGCNEKWYIQHTPTYVFIGTQSLLKEDPQGTWWRCFSDVPCPGLVILVRPRMKDRYLHLAGTMQIMKIIIIFIINILRNYQIIIACCGARVIAGVKALHIRT